MGLSQPVCLLRLGSNSELCSNGWCQTKAWSRYRWLTPRRITVARAQPEQPGEAGTCCTALCTS